MDCAWNELLAILPWWIRRETDRLARESLQEIRLRLGSDPEFILKDGRKRLFRKVLVEDIHFTVNAASQYSPWSVSTAANGYLTAPGGHRIGLCGEVVLKDGSMTGFRQITSLNIRVNRNYSGICADLWKQKGSVLIIGNPGYGKTTLLRDLIRNVSQVENISVVDERGEIFPAVQGSYCFDIGPHTDILTGCGKKHGIEILLRTMTPNTIAVDEVTNDRDCDAVIQALNCGIRILATAHASGIADLKKRRCYAPLLDGERFQTIVLLQADKSWRTERECVCL